MRLRRSRGRREPLRESGAERAPFMLRHPRGVLGVFAVIVVVLAILGFQVQERLSPTSLDISNTAAFEANELLRENFGNTALFAVLLQGPADEIDAQGPRLVRALRATDPKVTTLSPWDRGSVGRLRPSPDRALIITDFHVDIAHAVKHSVEELDEILEREIKPPVKSTQSGFPTLSRALQEESIDASERAELIALPVLLIVLLLVFRSPIAAGIPLVFGAITVFISSGVLTIVTNWVGVDAFALVVCSMMGLALGVDYSLLMVSRYREELLGGADPWTAAVTTRKTAGRTTVFAGSTLIAAMIVAFFVVPGALLESLAATVILVVALSVSVATIAGPAVLTLLGNNVNRWRIGSPVVDESAGLMAIVGAALRRPALVCIVVGAVVLALAAPTIGLETGPPSPEQLSHNNQARKDAELINETISPGFDAPFVVVAEADRGTITTPRRLEDLRRWQDKVAKIPGVQVVIGPQQVAKAVAPLREAGQSLLAKEGGPVSNLERLGVNLRRAANGVTQLRGGIAEATEGAGLLAQGSDGAEEGALRLAGGLAKAVSGSEEAAGGLSEFTKGAHTLAERQGEAVEGSEFIKTQIETIRANLKNNQLRIARKHQKSLTKTASQTVPPLEASAKSVDEQLKSLVQLLEGMTVGKGDPNYGQALDAARSASAQAAGVSTGLTELGKKLNTLAEEAREVSFWAKTGIEELGKLEPVATQLMEGERKLRKGNQDLAEGSDEIVTESAKLEEGLTRLGTGAVRLAGGIGELGEGADTLQVGLGDAFHRSYPLQTGLHRAAARVISSADQLDEQTDRLRHQSPRIFDSGYFVLSALDGANARLRRQASQAVDLDGGGQAATVTVFTRYTFNSPGSIRLNKRLEREASQLSSETGLATGVAGGAAQLNEYSKVTRERIPVLVAVITFATFLILVVILRAIPLAAIAVLLNLATVGVAFGVLTLLFNVPDGYPFGGHTYVDAVGAMMMFGIIFGLSIDYAVFLLVRMRERYEADGDNGAAIEFGLEKTARVITGAAAIMMGVFVAFAGAPIANVSQLGIGLTVAVFLDATVVRIVFLPALMLLFGERVWWMPRFIQRLIPRVDV